MRDHIIHGSIAAVVAVAVSAGAVHYAPKHVEQVTHSIAVSKHAWPDLTDVQKAAFAAAVKGLRYKVDIVSADAAATDLAQDLDDAFEDAKVSSALDRSFYPLGYGIELTAARGDKQLADAGKVASALKAALSDRYAVTVVPGNRDFMIITIGKRPR